jgi:hypothetical protein
MRIPLNQLRLQLHRVPPSVSPIYSRAAVNQNTLALLLFDKNAWEPKDLGFREYRPEPGKSLRESDS